MYMYITHFKSCNTKTLVSVVDNVLFEPRPPELRYGFIFSRIVLATRANVLKSHIIDLYRGEKLVTSPTFSNSQFGKTSTQNINGFHHQVGCLHIL